MILIVGLGNPGSRYAETRHNIGFVVVERIVSRACGTPWKQRFSGLVSELELGGQRALALEPQTFMNRSGESVRSAASFYKIAPRDILVIHDELDLPFGTVRLKLGGGEAGHNGLRSVTEQLGTRDYVRVRVGIGKPPPGFRGDGADFVLQAFAPAERASLDDLVDRAGSAVALLAERGLEHAMNVTHRRES